jgi:ankyrin repeat protein
LDFPLDNPTLLQLATASNQEDIVEFLLSLGADPNDFGGAVSFAVMMSLFSILELRSFGNHPRAHTNFTSIA